MAKTGSGKGTSASSRKASSSKEASPLSLVIEGRKIVVTPEDVPLDEVQLDGDNPRIREALREAGYKRPTRDQIKKLVWGMSGVQDLYKNIRDNGGLIERILIKDDGTIVEGNCRTVCYLHLSETFKADAAWKAIPAMRLPPGATDREIAVVQANWHVNNKQTWGPYEKAGQLHHMHKNLKMEIKEICKSIGTQDKVVRRLIQAYGIVQDQIVPKLGRSEGIKKFSYVEEFLKNKKLQDLREDPRAVGWFVDTVIRGKFSRGEEVRQLHQIVKSSRAKEALVTKGHKAAMKVLAKRDPSIGSLVFRKLQAATEALNSLQANSDEAEQFKSDPKAQKILRELSDAVRGIAKMSKVPLVG